MAQRRGRWLDDQFTALDCVNPAPAAKVLLADRC